VEQVAFRNGFGSESALCNHLRRYGTVTPTAVRAARAVDDLVARFIRELGE
jgi:hypothetical protein